VLLLGRTMTWPEAFFYSVLAVCVTFLLWRAFRAEFFG